jgi:hypothetical protein
MKDPADTIVAFFYCQTFIVVVTSGFSDGKCVHLMGRQKVGSYGLPMLIRLLVPE